MPNPTLLPCPLLCLFHFFCSFFLSFLFFEFLFFGHLFILFHSFPRLFLASIFPFTLLLVPSLLSVFLFFHPFHFISYFSLSFSLTICFFSFCLSPSCLFLSSFIPVTLSLAPSQISILFHSTCFLFSYCHAAFVFSLCFFSSLLRLSFVSGFFPSYSSFFFLLVILFLFRSLAPLPLSLLPTFIIFHHF